MISANDLWATPERIDLAKLVTAFTIREIIPNLPAWEEAGELPRRLHSQAGKLGLLELGGIAQVSHRR